MRNRPATIAITARGHSRFSRLRLVYPDRKTHLTYDAALARQLLANTVELPSSKHALMVMLTEYRHALSDLTVGQAADHATGQVTTGDAT